MHKYKEKNMDLFNKTKKIIIKIDDFREEKLDSFIANDILAKIDESTTVDELEEKGIMTAITAANAYAATYGLPACPDEIKKQIAKEVVKQLGKANKLIQKQLNKKSKAYIARHSEKTVN
jgi:hypothetical protein